MTTRQTNETTIQQWNTMPRKVMEAMDPDGDFAKRHLINPVLLRMVGDVQGLRVLGAGSGQGYLSRMLATRGAHVTAVEPTDAMFTYSQEKEQALQQGIDHVQAGLSRLPDLERFRGEPGEATAQRPGEWRACAPVRNPRPPRATWSRVIALRPSGGPVLPSEPLGPGAGDTTVLWRM